MPSTTTGVLVQLAERNMDDTFKVQLVVGIFIVTQIVGDVRREGF